MNSETSTLELVYNIIREIDNLTVGELTEVFNSQYPDLAMPRGEMSKRVSHLKNENKIKALSIRQCSVGKRPVIEWTHRTEEPVTPEIIDRARRNLENAKKRVQEAFIIYESLTKNN